MLLITGGAGFIGSVLHAALAAGGADTIVCDRLGSSGKWRNLAHFPPMKLIAPEALPDYLATGPVPEAIVHLGAISATTATDGDLTWSTNVAFSQMLWDYCTARGVRFVYASSAATYGNGDNGFDDDLGLDYLRKLRPLNLYGWTKHAFDLWVATKIARGEKTPPQWAGLKFFNVYGPNEYHKESMISVVKVKYDEIRRGERPRLFKSDREGIGDGEQRRDFIWVNDVVDVISWLLRAPRVGGLFNVGTGVARSYLDLAHATCRAAGSEPAVDFVDLPERLRGQYQYFTQARMERLRAAGYNAPFTSLEDGIRTYVQDYLDAADSYV